MSQRQYAVGTDPVLLAQDNPNRTSVSVSMIPSSIAAANTGVVYIGKGFPPSAVIGAPSSGDPISQGSQFAETEQFVNDPSVFRGQIWAVADTAGQLIVVDETSRSAPTS